ncbi:MAG: putative esterase [Yoonia sp.]|jgi:predicted esterase
MNVLRCRYKGLRTLFLLLAVCSGVSISQASINELNLDLSQTSVSGLSSGGYMATQFQLSHSQTIIGAGIVGAGPYYCALGDIGTALRQCVNKVSSTINNQAFLEKYKEYLSLGLVAPSAALQDDRVKLIHGKDDGTVNRKASDMLARQYRAWLSAQNFDYVSDKDFAHHMPTISAGNACDVSASPFLGDCDYDAAGEILSFIYSELSPPTTNQILKVDTINIAELANLEGTSINENAFIFVPKACKTGESCKLHISFHGCNQSADDIGKVYAEQAGYNRWADVNNMVVLYPQVKKSMFMPLNPQGCWDWWGYTDENYANKNGPQVNAIYKVMQALAKGNR